MPHYTTVALASIQLIISVVSAQPLPDSLAILSGTVADAETGRPLVGAHVFLHQTTVGTVTDTTGAFRMMDLPPGPQELVVSMLGYALLAVQAASGDTLHLTLHPRSYTLDAVQVTAIRPPNRAAHLAHFEQLFLGTSDRAKDTRLLNPDVLHFTYNATHDALTAEASSPLYLENQALGYHIRFHLTSFRATPDTLTIKGKTLFTPLITDRSSQLHQWQINRKAAYAGSLRHFLTHLLQPEPNSGFLFQRPYGVHRDGTRDYGVPSRAQLLIPGPAPAVYTLNLPAPAGLEIQYPASSPDPYRSGITPLGVPILLTAEGRLLDPDVLFIQGHWSQYRVADWLPLEYQPE